MPTKLQTFKVVLSTKEVGRLAKIGPTAFAQTPN